MVRQGRYHSLSQIQGHELVLLLRRATLRHPRVHRAGWSHPTVQSIDCKGGIRHQRIASEEYLSKETEPAIRRRIWANRACVSLGQAALREKDHPNPPSNQRKQHRRKAEERRLTQVGSNDFDRDPPRVLHRQTRKHTERWRPDIKAGNLRPGVLQ